MTISPSIIALVTLSDLTASTTLKNFPVHSLPFRLQKVTRPRSIRHSIRYPSNFNSCSHLSPEGGSFTSVASCGETKAGNFALCDPGSLLMIFFCADDVMPDLAECHPTRLETTLS